MSKKARRIPPMVKRQRAMEATMTRFAGQNFKLGKADCIQLVRFHLVKMGHRGLPSTGKYKAEAGAKAALESQGVKTVEELLDKYLERIAPAAMLPGDIGLVEAEEGAPAWRAGTVVIQLPGRKLLGWHPDSALLAVVEPSVQAPFIGAWRA